MRSALTPPHANAWTDHRQRYTAAADLVERRSGGLWSAYEVSGHRMLLKQREVIQNRLQQATEAEKAPLSRKLAEPSLDEKKRRSIEGDLEKVGERDVLLEKERMETEVGFQQLAGQQRIEMARLELQAREMDANAAIRRDQAVADLKNRSWHTRLSRDSIAAIVGGVLLVGFAITVIIAMFTHTTTTDVVQNSFLLILGYFFGAAVGRRPESQGDRVRFTDGMAQ